MNYSKPTPQWDGARPRLRAALTRIGQAGGFATPTIDHWVATARIRHVTPHETWPSELEKAIICCVDGALRLQCGTKSTRRILDFVLPGELAVVPPAFLGRWTSYVAIHRALTTVAIWPAQILPQLMTSVPSELMEGFMRTTRMGSACTAARMAIVSRGNTTDRLRALLTDLADRAGITDGNGRIVDVALTHQDIGHATDRRREQCTRKLRIMHQDGEIERRPAKRFWIRESNAESPHPPPTRLPHR